LLVDKPAGPTSHDVVARVRRALQVRAVGHTGTLDPFATGLLVVLVGRATRLARFVEAEPKTYLATARLGVRTTTDDLTGAVVESEGAGMLATPPAREEVAAILASFLGPQRQRPPAFSAKHVAGERSHAKARRGEAVELAEVDIVVHSVELVGYDYPELRFRTRVSAGTYVRVLARDLGDRLGTAAHLLALRREAIGAMRVEQATPLEEVSPESLLPPLSVLGHLPRVEVTEAEAIAVGYGRSVTPSDGETEARRAAAPLPGELVALTTGGRLIAVARWGDDGLHPEVVLEARN
jgi:tRNA pseudouridine55 synthase